MSITLTSEVRGLNPGPNPMWESCYVSTDARQFTAQNLDQLVCTRFSSSPFVLGIICILNDFLARMWG